MNTATIEYYKIQFSQVEGEPFISLDRGEEEAWRTRVSDIKVVSYYKGGDGDHEIEIIVFIDAAGNRLPLDLSLNIQNQQQVMDWLDETFGYREAVTELKFKEDSAPKVVYPAELLGVRAFDRSITTWLIRHIINAGYGVISPKVEAYLKHTN